MNSINLSGKVLSIFAVVAVLSACGPSAKYGTPDLPEAPSIPLPGPKVYEATCEYKISSERIDNFNESQNLIRVRGLGDAIVCNEGYSWIPTTGYINVQVLPRLKSVSLAAGKIGVQVIPYATAEVKDLYAKLKLEEMAEDHGQLMKSESVWLRFSADKIYKARFEKVEGRSDAYAIVAVKAEETAIVEQALQDADEGSVQIFWLNHKKMIAGHWDQSDDSKFTWQEEDPFEMLKDFAANQPKEFKGSYVGLVLSLARDWQVDSMMLAKRMPEIVSAVKQKNREAIKKDSDVDAALATMEFLATTEKDQTQAKTLRIYKELEPFYCETRAEALAVARKYVQEKALSDKEYSDLLSLAQKAYGVAKKKSWSYAVEFSARANSDVSMAAELISLAADLQWSLQRYDLSAKQSYNLLSKKMQLGLDAKNIVSYKEVVLDMLVQEADITLAEMAGDAWVLKSNLAGHSSIADAMCYYRLLIRSHKEMTAQERISDVSRAIETDTLADKVGQATYDYIMQ